MSSEGSEFVSELRRLADPEDFPIILKACAGRRIYWPSDDFFVGARAGWLVKAIGPEKTRSLVKRFAEESWFQGRVLVPMTELGSYAVFRSKVDKLFAQALEAGKSTAEIATLCGISDRAVQLRKAKLQKKQDRSKSKSKSKSKLIRGNW